MTRTLTSEEIDAKIKESLQNGMDFMRDVILRRIQKSNLLNKEEVIKVVKGDI